MSTPAENNSPSIPPKAGNEKGDATGGLIPHKNPYALAAYYLGIFSIIPVLGLILGGFALGLGIAGLKARKQRPVIRGSAHAWIGIICGGLSVSIHLLLVGLLVYSEMRHH